jgi:hypothetical protein
LTAFLKKEQEKAERFATRFILVQGCSAWDSLIPKLNLEVDRVVRLSDFCSASDVFPDMERLRSFLESDVSGCHSILLIPLAECIRIDPETRDVIKWLAVWPAEKINRIYVPLLAVEEFFDEAINRVPRYHEKLLPDSLVLRGNGDSEVIVAPFSAKDDDRKRINGIREYLSLWSQKSIRKAWLVTEMAKWLPLRETRGECRISIYPSSFDYVRRSFRWEEIREEWGTCEQWDWLAARVNQDEDLNQLAARLLEVIDYNSGQLFNMWQRVSKQLRWLIWLWSKARSKPETYLYDVIQKNNSINDFGYHASTQVFYQTLPIPLRTSEERKQLLEYLGIDYMPPTFWNHYNALTDPLHKISVLTDISQQERKEVVECVRELLIRKIDQSKWWDYLVLAFPALAWYLQPAVTGDEFADNYFRVFNRCRVKDSPNKHLNSQLDRWAGEQLLWNYRPRSDRISQLRAEGAKILWVDGLGMEWTGLLTRHLCRNREIDCSLTIARCNLPTTTEANREWETDEEVDRELDSIAHHYDYSFPESFLKAMEVVERVANRALALLAQHPVVVITSDHGLSRFVVSHMQKKRVPDGLEAEASGRFASVKQGSYHTESHYPLLSSQDYAIWLTHDSFQVAGSCRGEAHGGATPEECLVPIIVLRKISEIREKSAKFTPITTPVKLNVASEGSLIIRSDRVIVERIELRVTGYQVPGHSEDGLNWSFHLRDWKPGRYRGRLFSANRLIGEVCFEAVKGILEQDVGL